MLSEVVVQRNGTAIEMAGIGMGMAMGVILMSGMGEWEVSVNVDGRESQY